MAVGLEQVCRALPQQSASIVLALPVMLLILNWSYVDLSSYRSSWQTAETRLTTIAPDAIFMAHWGEASAMQYHQLVRGVRSDVTVVNPFFFRDATVQRQMIARQLERVPLYTTDEIAGGFEFRPISDYFTIESQQPIPQGRK
jgi:hypothetical protein